MCPRRLPEGSSFICFNIYLIIVCLCVHLDKHICVSTDSCGSQRCRIPRELQAYKTPTSEVNEWERKETMACKASV